MVVEVMGRHTGWIAVMSGIAGGADVILIPEQPITVEEACAELEKRHGRGKDFSIVVVSEGYKLTYASGEQREVTQEEDLDAFGHVRLGGVGDQLAREIEQRTGFETRVTVLGHVQRGGSPTARDRVLATRYGLKAADLVEAGDFGKMAALQGDSIVAVSLADATARAEDRAARVVRRRPRLLWLARPAGCAGCSCGGRRRTSRRGRRSGGRRSPIRLRSPRSTRRCV